AQHPPVFGKAPPPLIGRAQDLTHLARHLAGDGPPFLFLAGEPGIGKSRLLTEASQRARRGGWTLLRGGGLSRRGTEPYAPLLTALDGHLRHQLPPQQRLALEGCGWLVRLLPELTAVIPAPAPFWPLPPNQERRLMFAAVARYLTNIAGVAGTLLL